MKSLWLVTLGKSDAGGRWRDVAWNNQQTTAHLEEFGPLVRRCGDRRVCLDGTEPTRCVTEL